MQKEEENQSNQPVSPSRDRLSQIPPETLVHCFAKLPNPHQALFKHPGTKTAAAAHAAEAKQNTPCLHCALGASSFYLLQFIGASDGEGFAFVSSPTAYMQWVPVLPTWPVTLPLPRLSFRLRRQATASQGCEQRFAPTDKVASYSLRHRLLECSSSELAKCSPCSC